MMPDTIPDIPDGSDSAVVQHELPREVTSWKLAGLVASDGRAFLRCTFDQEIGGTADPDNSEQFVDAEKNSFTVHWEMSSLKEFVAHIVAAATEIERRAAAALLEVEVLPQSLPRRLAAVGAGLGAGSGCDESDAYRAGYL